MKYLFIIAIIFFTGCQNPSQTIDSAPRVYHGSAGDTLIMDDTTFTWINFPLEFFTGETISGSYQEVEPIQYPDYDTTDTLNGPVYNRYLFYPDSCEGWKVYIPYSTTEAGFYYPIGTDGNRGLNYTRVQ